MVNQLTMEPQAYETFLWESCKFFQQLQQQIFKWSLLLYCRIVTGDSLKQEVSSFGLHFGPK